VDKHGPQHQNEFVTPDLEDMSNELILC